uniref:Uncharacterized protein n=1 Tax=Odontella aurita TaxID=265563 RepID=A0A7S4KB75_9STRA
MLFTWLSSPLGSPLTCEDRITACIHTLQVIAGRNPYDISKILNALGSGVQQGAAAYLRRFPSASPRWISDHACMQGTRTTQVKQLYLPCFVKALHSPLAGMFATKEISMIKDGVGPHTLIRARESMTRLPA